MLIKPYVGGDTMGEIPYREVVEGAKFLMKMPLEKQLRMIELIMRTVPADIDEAVKKMIEEIGPAKLEDIKEVLAFTLAIIKGLTKKDMADIIKDLKHMGFSEANARAIVEKIIEEMPSAERDAELLKELDPDALLSLVEGWARFFMGDYDDLDEWRQEAGLPSRYLLAASRFFESALKSILTGEMSTRRLASMLEEEYKFGREQAEAVSGVLEKHLDELSRVLLFRYLRRIMDALE